MATLQKKVVSRPKPKAKTVVQSLITDQITEPEDRGSVQTTKNNEAPRFIIALAPRTTREKVFKTGAHDKVSLMNMEAPNLAEMSPSHYRVNRPIKLTKPKTDRGSASVDLRKPKEKPVEDEDTVFRKRLTTPLKQERLDIDDENHQDILGQTAIRNFYSHYKKLDKVKDVNNFVQIKDAVYTSVLGKTEKLKLLPSKIGFIKQNGETDAIKLNHFRLGDKYAEVLSEGIKSVKAFSNLELANNRISAVGADHLLTKLNNTTQNINLSGNNIGRIGAEHLCKIIELRNSKLVVLNLEGNKLGDTSVGQLCDAVGNSSTLRKLNLGKNFLSDNVTEKISKMLESNSSLEELYLQWNQIKSPGGTTLVNGLKAASKLKLLDLSWNSLGQNGSNFAKAFAAYISTNTILQHLDLSNNYITKADAKLIAEDLKSNHTLYGFHFHGNSGYVDYKGFLIVPEEGDESVTGRVTQPPIDGAKYQPESLKHHIGNWGDFRDVCWICEGWRPIEVAWTPGTSGPSNQDPVYTHLSFEGYKGVFLNSKNNFRIMRMVPPTRFEYFFTADGIQTHAEDLASARPQSYSIKMKLAGEEKSIRLNSTNFINKSEAGKMYDDDFELLEYIKDSNIKPRIVDEEYIPPEVQIIRPKWKFQVSVFRNYKVDTQALYDECFKLDMEGGRISKIVKNPDDYKIVRDTLYESYKPLRDCYKYYAAVGAQSDIWCITLNTYTELCQNAKIIDNKIVKLSDFDRIFIATYTKPPDKEKNHRNPDRALVRYQFFEGLVRLAEHKYIGSGVVTTHGEAIKLLMSESMTPYIGTFNQETWRSERYWTEEVDVVYKSYLPLLRGIYRKYYGEKTLPGQKKFMCLEEFHRLANDAGMFNDNCGEREAQLSFSMAMMTQVDELSSDRTSQMQFVEFLEALARLAEKSSAHPYGYLQVNPETGLVENEMTYEQRNAQPLHMKLEGVMPFLFAVSGSDVKEFWQLPDASIFLMTEVDPKPKYNTKKKKLVRINPTHPSSIEPYEGVNALQI